MQAASLTPGLLLSPTAWSYRQGSAGGRAVCTLEAPPEECGRWKKHPAEKAERHMPLAGGIFCWSLGAGIKILSPLQPAEGIGVE